MAENKEYFSKEVENGSRSRKRSLRLWRQWLCWR